MSDYVASILAQIYAEAAFIEGMKAENQSRISRGLSAAYGEDAFFRASNTLIHYAECIINHGEAAGGEGVK